jgi:hypothetical protein
LSLDVSIGRGTKADIEIVGVVRGAKYSQVDEKIPREVYLAFAQDAKTMQGDGVSQLTSLSA